MDSCGSTNNENTLEMIRNTLLYLRMVADQASAWDEISDGFPYHRVGMGYCCFLEKREYPIPSGRVKKSSKKLYISHNIPRHILDSIRQNSNLLFYCVRSLITVIRLPKIRRTDQLLDEHTQNTYTTTKMNTFFVLIFLN